MLETAWKIAVAAFGAVTSYLFGGWSMMFAVLLTLSMIDYFTGMGAAAVEGAQGKGPGLNSARGRIGIARKLGIFCMVAVCHLADRLMGDAHAVRDAALWFYSGNEILSITENLGRIGVPIPPLIMQAVEVLRGKAGAKTTKT